MPNDVTGLVLMVFLLGLRHGMDPDHLATIDGLTRYNARDRPHLARWSGCLFSFGHGAVVTLVAGFVAATLHEGAAPAWLERVGTWLSIAFLLALGALNIAAVFRTPPEQVVRTAGLKGRWLGRLIESGHPVVIVSIGAAFALSFDTVSQAALFSLTGVHLAGWRFSIALGLVFMLGMTVTDGANGIWVARLLRRADRSARIASRVTSLSIALLGMAIACLGLVRLASPEAASALAGTELRIGAGFALLVLASFLIAMRLVSPRGAESAGS
jgi:nickel/cobalt transporter (NiCoT) family protein